MQMRDLLAIHEKQQRSCASQSAPVLPVWRTAPMRPCRRPTQSAALSGLDRVAVVANLVEPGLPWCRFVPAVCWMGPLRARWRGRGAGQLRDGGDARTGVHGTCGGTPTIPRGGDAHDDEPLRGRGSTLGLRRRAALCACLINPERISLIRLRGALTTDEEPRL